MRRWLAVILLLVLPLQFAWAVAAPYCAHEAASAAIKHPGHHEHVHQDGSDAANAGDVGDAGAALGANHTDCASCHAGVAATLPPPAAALPSAPRDMLREPPPSRYQSHTPSGPERPDIA